MHKDAGQSGKPILTLTPQRQCDRDLIIAAIKALDISARRFATEVVFRNERTVRDWVKGESPVPKAVKEKCQQILEESGEAK